MSEPVRTRSAILPAALAGGGTLALLALWFARRTRSQAQAAVATGGAVKVRLTTYWPLKAGLSEQQRKMEGGTNDRKGRPIITWEQHISDPTRYPYVSVAGDYNIWPYGQRLVLLEFPNVVLRVVDTGGHFFGSKKVFRVTGAEPLDIAVSDDKSHDRLGIPRVTSVRVIPGDNFAGGAAVAYSKLPGPVVVGAAEDLDALARMVESCFSRLSDEEARAGAWTVRNRANNAEVAIRDILAPRGTYGADAGYASTRLPATARSARIALEVISAPAEVDPTGGANGFWLPERQDVLRSLGATVLGEDDVRRGHELSGVRSVGRVGAVELLLGRCA